MRGLFLLLITGLAAPLAAEDLRDPVPVTSAVIYPTFAVTTREAAFDAPAGSHRILVPGLSADGLRDLRVSGARVTGQSTVSNDAPGAEDLFLEGQLAVRAARDAAEAARDGAADALAAAHADIRALEARLAFHLSVGAPEGGATPDELAALADFVATGVSEAEAALVAAQGDLRARQEALAEAEADLEAAERAVGNWGASSAPLTLYAIEVEADGGPLTLAIDQFAPAQWMPSYELELTTGAAPSVTITRQALVRKDGTTPWVGVDVTLSTLAPDDTPTPSFVSENILRAAEPPRAAPTRELSGIVSFEEADVMVAEPMMEPEILAFSTERAEFSLPGPVTLLAKSPLLQVLGTETLDAEVALHAVPRTDDTAFWVATFTNEGAPIFAGEASRYRDGLLVASGDAGWIGAEIATGEEAELGFGAHEGLRLEMVRLDELSGDRGVIQRSNTREEVRELRVENLSDAAETVRLFYNLPVSVQEDLRIRIDMDPAPDMETIDDKRGVVAWDLDVAAGATEAVRLTFDLRWPEDQQLYGGP